MPQLCDPAPITVCTRRLGTVLLLCTLLLLTTACREPVSSAAASPAATAAVTGRLQVLGQPPLCEASAAARAPWQDDLVLVADNEIGDRLYALSLASTGLLTRQLVLPLPGQRFIKDIEALAVHGDLIVVVGSHGRKGSRCAEQAARRLVQLVTWNEQRGALEEAGRIDSSASWHQLTGSIEGCRSGLLVSPTPVFGEAICSAIVKAEATARPGHCMPVDIEAAAVVPTSNGDRLWLGLRQPRVNGQAVLLRLTPTLDRLQVDGVVLLAVGDRGLRALETDDQHLWAILGPTTREREHSLLWRLPLAAVQAGTTVTGEVVADDLPPSSEGLVLQDGRVTVLTDGSEPKHENDPCEEPAGQLLVVL